MEVTAGPFLSRPRRLPFISVQTRSQRNRRGPATNVQQFAFKWAQPEGKPPVATLACSGDEEQRAAARRCSTLARPEPSELLSGLPAAIRGRSLDAASRTKKAALAAPMLAPAKNEGQGGRGRRCTKRSLWPRSRLLWANWRRRQRRRTGVSRRGCLSDQPPLAPG